MTARRALVTGAASGMGRATARLFADDLDRAEVARVRAFMDDIDASW